jgi:hypothetical protein
MAFDYQSLIDEAMLGVVKTVLTKVHDEGLSNDQSLYVSFRTNFPDVILSKAVKEKYPKEITIVLQHQFKNLAILKDKFLVNIAFGGATENIEVPFAAITSFLDPAANFGFRFVTKKPVAAVMKKFSNKAEILSSASKFTNRTVSKAKKEGDVIAIDKFRKKREEK